MTKANKYWLFALSATLIISFYPLYMGSCVMVDMAVQGFVWQEDFPKYVIPYTPVALAVLAAVVIMPLLGRLKKWALPVASVLAAAVFFAAEIILENQTVAVPGEKVPLEFWQLALCYVPPEGWGTRTWKAVDVLLGGYDPSFKIHFYMIALVLVLSLMSCLYGFYNYFRNGNKCKLKSLVLQSIASILFLGLSILACFTSFFRDGELTVPPVSAWLMGIYFILLGVTAGLYTGSFLIGRSPGLSIDIPAGVSCLLTVGMYIGELCLLNWNLYRFGSGFFFKGLPGIVLAPVDILIILLSGCITALLCRWIQKKPESSPITDQ